MSLIKLVQSILCFFSFHNLTRTENFGERRCKWCNGSYWGHTTESKYWRYVGHYVWYSRQKLADIERLGLTEELINGTGEFSQDKCPHCKARR